MDNKPIGKCKCVDCGVFPIMIPEAMAIFVVNAEFYGVTRCIHCNRVILDEMSKETALTLFCYNVIVLNWNDGTQIDDQKVIETI